MLMINLLTRLTSLRIRFIMLVNSLPLWSASAMFSGLILTWAGKVAARYPAWPEDIGTQKMNLPLIADVTWSWRSPRWLSPSCSWDTCCRGSMTSAGFRTVQVKRGDLLATISATGTVEPEEVVDIGAQVAGRIVSFGKDKNGKEVDYGSVVEAGMVLARIDDALYAADVGSAKAQLGQNKAAVKTPKPTWASSRPNSSRLSETGPGLRSWVPPTPCPRPIMTRRSQPTRPPRPTWQWARPPLSRPKVPWTRPGRLDSGPNKT